VLFDDRLYCFYDDYKNGNIRMAARRLVNGAERWSFRPLDGNGRGHGRVTSLVRSTEAVRWSDRLSVFYVDDDLGHLRHAWVEPGWTSPWNYEIVDGAGGSNGRVATTVGRFPVPLAWGFDGVRRTLPLLVAYQGTGPAIRWAVLADPL
jgi:hypothetical protein